MRNLVNSSYAQLISPSLGATSLGITIVAIVLMVKFLPFLSSKEDSAETIASLRIFLFRVTVVFLGFLGANASGGIGASGVPDVVGPNGIASNFYIDGPLAMGTAIGASLSTVSSGALSTATGQPGPGVGGGGLFGTYGSGVSAGGASDDLNATFASAHVAAAQTMLLNMHQMGIIGIAVAVWLAVEDPNVSIWNPGVAVVIEAAALFMIWVFFMFTLTFGLKYIDALIRAMLIFSLMPLFMFLWIFDSTRSMSVQALKSGLALAGVFAVSGIVFTVAFFIMQLGYANAFANQNVAFAGMASMLSSLCTPGSTQIATMIGSTGQGASLNWMAYFYLVGTASIATACAGLAFDLAAQIFDFGRSADMGIASAVEADLQSSSQRVMRTVRGGL
jgi:hypothetical protein